jgi:uracil-DNA glycosylase
MLKTIHPDWMPHLDKALKSPAFKTLPKLLKKKHCPQNKQDIFKVLRMSLNNIKVVIIGQDPYPNPKYATGLAFAIPNDSVKVPYSLDKIIDAVAEATNNPLLVPKIREGYENDVPFQLDLEHWEQQGVFLLNKSLTCEQGKSNSHAKFWHPFTDLIIKIINRERNNITWCLWGKEAQKAESLITNSTHMILKAAHPAASAYGKVNFNAAIHFKLITKTYNISW